MFNLAVVIFSLTVGALIYKLYMDYKMIKKRIHAIADAYPILKKRKPFQYKYSNRNRVASAGPPSVMIKALVKTWNEPLER